MSAIPSREVTSSQIRAISFGFYSDDEVSEPSYLILMYATELHGSISVISKHLVLSIGSSSYFQSRIHSQITYTHISMRQILEVRHRILIFMPLIYVQSVQIRQLSVKQIVSPIVFDNLRNPVPRGLYEPALGPLEQHGQSVTICTLTHATLALH